MPELSALLGLSLFDSIADNGQKRKNVVDQYKDHIKTIAGISLPSVPTSIETNYSYFCILVDPAEFGLSSTELHYALMGENIVTRCYFFPPVHRTSYYQSRPAAAQAELPATDWAATHALCLPVHAEMTAEEIAIILAGIKRCQDHAAPISKKLVSKIPASWEDIGAPSILDPYNTFILKNNP